MRLDELGERRIINEILRPRYGSQDSDRFGDDCAFIAEVTTLANGVLVATTDPCPEPMASILGYTDFYYRGWLLATINLSDLAAAGARPLGFLTSLILRNDTTVSQLIRLLDGIDDCCRQNGTKVIGGNIKEGAKVDLTGTAIGLCESGKNLSRHGCEEGDLIVMIGDLGLFWAGVLSVQRQILTESTEPVLLHNVLTPTPKVSIGQELARRGLLTACLDNSDGLYASLSQLADINRLQMHVNIDSADFPPAVQQVCETLRIDPVRLALGWGDWQLIGCCNKNKLDELRELALSHDISTYIIGQVKQGEGVVLEHKRQVGKMAPIDSQRFTRDSWFTVGLGAYIDLLIEGPLWA
jgi:thiamine-monophosphate kinase